jgi:hypothetical protein
MHGLAAFYLRAIHFRQMHGLATRCMRAILLLPICQKQQRHPLLADARGLPLSANARHSLWQLHEACSLLPSCASKPAVVRHFSLRAAAPAAVEEGTARRFASLGPDLWNTTYYPTGEDVNSIKKTWYLVDAEGQTLGRLAVLVAEVLRFALLPWLTLHTCNIFAVCDVHAVCDVYDVFMPSSRFQASTIFAHTAM